MADLTGERSRAQMLLIGAFALATVLVVLALLLNSAIYTENRATRGQATVNSGQAATFVGGLDRNVGSLVTHLNEDLDVDTYSVLESEVVTNTNEITAGIESQYANRGFLVEVPDISASSVTHGTRIVQDTDTLISGPGNSPDWTVVSNQEVRRFELSVDPDAIPTIADRFTIKVTDSASDTWEITFHQTGSGEEVTVFPPVGSSESCTASVGTTSVGITNASMAGRPCPALEPILDLPGPYTVEIRNGDEASGTYELTVDDEKGDLSTTYNDPGEGTSATDQPWAVPAIYDVLTEFEYRSLALRFDGEILVAPGEFDD